MPNREASADLEPDVKPTPPPLDDPALVKLRNRASKGDSAVAVAVAVAEEFEAAVCRRAEGGRRWR